MTGEDKARLAIALSQVCALQQAYGKTRAELETLVDGFCWAMEGYSMESIINALQHWVRGLRKTTIPTPADLLNIIDPPKEPLTACVYMEIKKRSREGEYIYPKERDYCDAFEAQEVAKNK